MKRMGAVGTGRNREIQFLSAAALAFWATGIAAAGSAGASASAATATPTACPHAVAATAAPKALAGVTAISAKDAWAVGWTSGALPKPILAHWNGSNWSTVSSPTLQTPAVLLAVAKFRGGLWAVGASGQTVGGQHR